MALQLHFTGLNLAKLKGVTRGDLVEAINFFLDKLISKRMKNSLSLFIKFNDKMPNDGDCIYLDDLNRPKQFEINIKVNSATTYRNFMRSIAHELVHVKQWCTGEMRDYVQPGIAGQVLWRKEKYDISKLDYWFFPWEIEAHGLEVGLYTHFRRYKRNQKNKKTSNNSTPVRNSHTTSLRTNN